MRFGELEIFIRPRDTLDLLVTLQLYAATVAARRCLSVGGFHVARVMAQCGSRTLPALIPLERLERWVGCWGGGGCCRCGLLAHVHLYRTLRAAKPQCGNEERPWTRRQTPSGLLPVL